MSNVRGFSLIELMIVVAIIGILSMIALPSYQRYTERARFVEVITAVEPYKIAVAIAIQSGIDLSELSNGKHDIPNAPIPTQNVESISVENGTITATATSTASGATYTLKPNRDGSRWTIGGTCLKNGTCSA